MVRIISFLFIIFFSYNGFASTEMVLDGKKGKIILDNKNVLLINIATRCGYTPQLEGLEKIYQKYKSRGLLVIGVPSNEFASQSPENDKEIEKFCKLNYGVTFPLAKKTIVLGAKKNRVFKHLLEKTNKEEIKWNFEKFLISKSGKVQRFSSSVSPSSKTLMNEIEKVLK